MCFLRPITKGLQASGDLAKARRDTTGNLAQIPGVLPGYIAPVVGNAPGGVTELTAARRGMASPAFAPKGRKSDPGVTNARNRIDTVSN